MNLHSEPISESKIIKLVHEKDLDIISIQEMIKLVEIKKFKARLRPNPSLNLKEESLYQKIGPSEQEQSLSLTVPIDLSSRRNIGIHFAEQKIELTRLKMAYIKTKKTKEALILFYKLIAKQHKEKIQKYEVDHLSEVIRVIENRHQQGSSSGYDLVRIEIELELLNSILRQTIYEIENLKEELLTRLGKDFKASQFKFKASQLFIVDFSITCTTNS